MIRTVQLNQIKSAPFMTDIPSSGQSLKYCSTLARRQPQPINLSQPEIETLRNWSTDNTIPYLIIETRNPTYNKTLLLSLLQQVQTASRPIIWALRYPEYLDRNPNIEDILRTIVLHALEININSLALEAFPITLSSPRAASTQEDWLTILNRELAGLEEVYIIVDPDLLRFAAEDNSCTAADLLLALGRGVTSTRLKIVVSSFGINKRSFKLHSVAGSWKTIGTDDEQRQRMAKIKRHHFARVRRMRGS